MELRDAVEQIGQIHQHMGRSRLFRGYRSTATALTGLIALSAAAGQALWLVDAAGNVETYLLLWTITAVLCVTLEAGTIAIRFFRCNSVLERDTTLCAVQQLFPSLAGGLLLTIVLYLFARDVLWMLPGLWAILFSIGIFASRAMLPPATRWIGGFYLLAGLLALAIFQGDRAFSPAAMTLTFGVGQLLSAFVLYWTLERNHAAP